MQTSICTHCLQAPAACYHPSRALLHVEPDVWLQVREYLEKHYAETSGRETMKLAIKALSETVEASSKNVEIAVVDRASGLKFLSDAEVDSLVADIDSEKTASDAARKQRVAEASGTT